MPHYEVNGHVVEFANEPSEQDIDEAASQLGPAQKQPGIDFGQAANAAGKALINPSPADMVQGGGNQALAAGQAALGSVYGQGKEALQKAIPDKAKSTIGDIIQRVLPLSNLFPKKSVGGAATGLGIDVASGIATEGVGPIAKMASKAASGVAEGAEENAGRVMNQYLKPREAQFSFGKNPGKEIAKQGIMAWNRPDLGEKVNTKLGELHQNLQDIVNQHESGGITKVDLTPAFQKISSQIQELSKLPETTGTQQEDLKSFGRDLYALADGNPSQVSPAKALEIKRLIGKMPSWAAKDPRLGTQSNIARQVYGAIDSSMDSAMPETKGLNDSISNLIGAKTALKSGLAREQNKSFVGLFDRLGLPGLAGALGFSQGGTPEAALAGGATLAAQKIASSAAGRTTIAKTLADTGKTASGASEVLSLIKGPQIVKNILALFEPTAEEQALLTDTKQLPFPKGRGNFKGSASGPTIKANGPNESIQIPEMLDSDKSMARKNFSDSIPNKKALPAPQGFELVPEDKVNRSYDKKALSDYGIPEYGSGPRESVKASDIQPVERGSGKPLIQSKKLRAIVDELLKRRKSNFGD